MRHVQRCSANLKTGLIDTNSMACSNPPYIAYMRGETDSRVFVICEDCAYAILNDTIRYTNEIRDVIAQALEERLTYEERRLKEKQLGVRS